MSDDQGVNLPNLDSFKDDLIKQFEKMSEVMQEEKKSFNEQMVCKKSDFDQEVKRKLIELATGKKEIEHEKRQLNQDKADFANKSEQKLQSLKRMKEEIESNKHASQKEITDQVKNKSENEKVLCEIEQKSKKMSEEKIELADQKLSIDKELKILKQMYSKEEREHFQKIAALKKELDKLEDEIEQKLFLVAGSANTDNTKKSRELIIETTTGDAYRGFINIDSNERLSDMFTKEKTPFVVMYDVVFKGEEKATVIINKHNIATVKPLDNPANVHSSDEKVAEG